MEKINSDSLNLENRVVVFLGGRNQHRKIPNLKFCHKGKMILVVFVFIKLVFLVSSIYTYDEEKGTLVNYDLDKNIIRRRYYLIEKIKDSSTLGIIIGTLSVKNYLKVIDRLKEIIKLNHKKYYLVSVGKPTVAKLANFPEVIF